MKEIINYLNIDLINQLNNNLPKNLGLHTKMNHNSINQRTKQYKTLFSSKEMKVVCGVWLYSKLFELSFLMNNCINKKIKKTVKAQIKEMCKSTELMNYD